MGPQNVRVGRGRAEPPLVPGRVDEAPDVLREGGSRLQHELPQRVELIRPLAHLRGRGRPQEDRSKTALRGGGRAGASVDCV